jgi:hypothetical protein
MARPVGRNRWWTRDRFRDVINAEHMLRQRVGVQSDCGVDERIAVILHEGQSNGNIGVGKLIMEDRIPNKISSESRNPTQVKLRNLQ